jgi:hypothetical protein
VRLVAVTILPQKAQDTGSGTELSPLKLHDESEVWDCWWEVWHRLRETRLNLLKCHIPSLSGPR